MGKVRDAIDHSDLIREIEELQRLVDRLRARIFDLERRTGVLSRYPPDDEKKSENRGLG